MHCGVLAQPPCLRLLLLLLLRVTGTSDAEVPRHTRACTCARSRGCVWRQGYQDQASSLEGEGDPAQASSRTQSRSPVFHGSRQPPGPEQLSRVAVGCEGLVPQWGSVAGVWQRELQRTAVPGQGGGGEQDRRPPCHQSAGCSELMDSSPHTHSDSRVRVEGLRPPWP